MGLTAQTVTSDMPIATAARTIMANELAKVQTYLPLARESADVTAVYEAHEAIRRTFTSYKLFAPFFEQLTINHYRRGLKRIMHYLGRSHETAVFVLNLAVYNITAQPPLSELTHYWQRQQNKIDAELQQFLGKRRQRNLLAGYANFVATTGHDVTTTAPPRRPTLIGHIAPVLIYQRMAAVRAFGTVLPDVTVKQRQQLRVQFKELHYTLQFFTSLMGEAIDPVFAGLKHIHDHLDDLNNASVAITLLQDMTSPKRELVTYRGYQEAELRRLDHSFLPLWQNFDHLDWRQQLATAVARL